MECLYAPWRTAYNKSTEQKHLTNNADDMCVFCTHIQHTQDSTNFILKRCSHTVVMFNRYPYNAGHLLIIPIDHSGHLENLSQATRSQMMELACASTTILQKAARPDGFNIGFNLGTAAGGSIPNHIHMHVLPRWSGDTNFLPTISQTKVISYDLPAMYADLKPHFDKLTW